MIAILTGCAAKGTQSGAPSVSSGPAAEEQGSKEPAEGSFSIEETPQNTDSSAEEIPQNTDGSAEEILQNEDSKAETDNEEGLQQIGEDRDGRYRIYRKELLREGLRIYGEFYLPVGEGPFPAVICAHGFAGNLTHMTRYAENFAENGIASYVFDFIGGGDEILSDGKMTDMSVLTEAKDLTVALDGIRKMKAVDPGKVFLLGESQGGYVASLTAAEASEKVRGLILFFPAYEIREDAKWISDLFGGNIPDEHTSEGHTVGRIYIEDALATDIFSYLPKYTGPVMMVHGTEDEVVPLAYSEKAVNLFPNAVLYKREGAHHGFFGEDFEFARDTALEFVLEKAAEP